MIDRRAFLIAALAAVGASAAPAQPSSGRFERIREMLGPGGRLGVAAFDTLTQRLVGFDADSRYPLCASFMVPLVGAILHKVDRSEASLADAVTFRSEDVVEHAPVVRRRLRQGRMTVRSLCLAALWEGDHSAANLLIRELGGPEVFNAFVRACGDSETRLDRYLPDLLENRPRDARDTTTPAAMAMLLNRLLYGDALSFASRAMLKDWTKGSRISNRNIGGMPPGWGDSHNYGKGENGASSDVAILSYFDRPEIVLAGFISGGDAPEAVRYVVHGRAASIVAAAAPLSAQPAPA